MIKEVEILKRYFKNSCKGFVFSSKWAGERICMGKEWVTIILIDGIEYIWECNLMVVVILVVGMDICALWQVLCEQLETIDFG